VLPSQLNGVDAPSPERVLKSLEECKWPGAKKMYTGGKNGGSKSNHKNGPKTYKHHKWVV
jgi:hypothetical protein